MHGETFADLTTAVALGVAGAAAMALVILLATWNPRVRIHTCDCVPECNVAFIPPSLDRAALVVCIQQLYCQLRVNCITTDTSTGTGTCTTHENMYTRTPLVCPPD